MEDKQSLWFLVFAPSVWAIHFLASYIGAAIWCGERTTAPAPMETIRLVILAAGAVALVLITMIGTTAWRRYNIAEGGPPLDRDTAEDRHRFLGLAVVLLASLSALGTIYTCLSVLFIRNCL